MTEMQQANSNNQKQECIAQMNLFLKRHQTPELRKVGNHH